MNNFRTAWCLGVLLATPVAAQALDRPAVSINPQGPPPTFVPASPPAPPRPVIDLTTLRALKAKGVLSEQQFDAALNDLFGAGAESPTVEVMGWKTTLYGYVQADFSWNSTQSFNDFSSNAQVARPDTAAGKHGRFGTSIRDSRFGFLFSPPAFGPISISANLEFDFLGAEGSGAIANAAATVSEAAFFVSPVLRVRMAWVKLQTPIVDVLFGQTWGLFGWQPYYVPTIAQLPGIAGEVFGRNTQLRVSKVFKTDAVTVELAVAGLRPPQRDSAVPEGQAGARLLFNHWTAWHSIYLISTNLMPASIGVSGTVRRLAIGTPFQAPEAQSAEMKYLTGTGIAVDAFLPIIPATKTDKSNSLALVAELVSGTSINDLYAGLTGGVSTPSTITMTGSIDPGMLAYDAQGTLRQPRWLTSVLSLDTPCPEAARRSSPPGRTRSSTTPPSSLPPARCATIRTSTKPAPSSMSRPTCASPPTTRESSMSTKTESPPRMTRCC